jgi:hypothetical protein
MGSQNVTNFSEAKMKRIRSLVKDYSKSTEPTAQVRKIGAAAVGTLEPSPERARKQPKKTKSKGAGGTGATSEGTWRPGNEFLQALSSPSMRDGVALITSFAEKMKGTRNAEKVYDEYGVGDVKRPVGRVSAVLTKELSDALSATQAETDAAFAAKGAIAKTIIDVVSRAFPDTPATDIDRQRLAEAFKKFKRDDVVTAFIGNVVGALIDLVLDATRGRQSPTVTAEIKRKVRQEFVPDFVEQLKRGSPGKR